MRESAMLYVASDFSLSWDVDVQRTKSADGQWWDYAPTGIVHVTMNDQTTTFLSLEAAQVFVKTELGKRGLPHA